MKRFLIAIATLSGSWIIPAAAQVTASLPVTCNASGTICVQSTPVVNPDGTNVGGGGSYNGPTAAQLPASLGAKTGANSLSVVPASDAGFAVAGTQARGVSITGNPVLNGGRGASTTPTAVTTGQIVDTWLGTSGQTIIGTGGSTTTPTATFTAANLIGDTGNNGRPNASFMFVSDGASAIQPARSIVGALLAGTGTQAVASAPHNAAGGAITPVAPSTALADSKVFCSAACNAYDARVNTTTPAVWVMAFNTTSKPADGAVTPADWWQLGTNSTGTLNFANGNIPTRWTTGMTLVCSSTGPFTLTASSTCTFSGRVQQ